MNNFFLLQEVSKFLNEEISGFAIKEIYTQEKDKLVMCVYNKKTFITKFIEFSTDNNLSYLLLKDEFSKAKKNVLNLLAGLYEQKISAVNIYNDDRIIRITLDSELIIFIVFFKSKYNLFVVAGKKIIDSFKNKKEVVNTYLEDYFSKKIAKEKKDNKTVNEFLKSHFRHFGDLILKEIVFSLGINSNSKINKGLADLIKSKILEINGLLKNPEFIIYKTNSEYLISLIRLKHLEKCEVFEYKNVNDLIQAYIKFFYGKSADVEVRKNILARKENALKNTEKKYQSLLQQLDYSKNYFQFKFFGNLILSNLHVLKTGDEKLVLEGEGYPEKIEIALKKDLSPSENASLYFEKYKKQKNSIDILNEKIKKQLYEVENIKKEIEEIKSNTNIKSLKMTEKEFTKENETSRFRKFILDEKYEVWVGKDSASNDLLTTRYSSQNDLWFHVRGASGSHTVLKTSDKKNPPEKKILVKAASIAAYYSKARNASNVPVAYTEKKYVKKKKGFKEGSVVMEREKVIFVKPGLPDF